MSCLPNCICPKNNKSTNDNIEESPKAQEEKEEDLKDNKQEDKENKEDINLILTNFENGIGQYTNLSSGYLGDFSNSYTNLTGMITTIGTQVNTTDSLTAAVKSDITTLEGEDENSSATELETNKVELEEIEA